MRRQIKIRRADVENTPACLTYFSSILSNQLQNFKLRYNSLRKPNSCSLPCVSVQLGVSTLYFLFVCISGSLWMVFLCEVCIFSL